MKKLFALLLALTLVLSLAACGGGGSKPTFTAEKYARLETGMTYEEVVEIIGFKGQLSNEAGSARVYNWDNLSKLDGKVDNNAVVTLYFSNDNEDKTYKLIQKNQTGFNLDDVKTPANNTSTSEAEGVRLPLTRL
ncbi:MAG: hypothetical protein LBN05_05705 [Oscillospiraceae bacterium]|jgi:predicted small lipoprotein YifL|nr:hypothetical protein [Oscillospiraceae bacterium]